MTSKRFKFGPSRLYVGRIDGDRSILEVHYSDGQPIEVLRPNPGSPHSPEFAWDYNGGGPNETSAAILAHALGERTSNGRGYTARVDMLCGDFTDVFIGDVHHDDVQGGFEIPGEIVLHWVSNNEKRITLENERDKDRVFTAAELLSLESPDSTVHGAPRSLSEVLQRH
jgi:hypothetical protein